MRLASESHQRIQAFLRDHFHNESLHLPPITVHPGPLANWMTRTFGVIAITFGQRVFVASDVVKRDSGGRVSVPAHLMAHEATHVVQYQEAGVVGFLASYLRDYGRGLKAQGSFRKAARQAAYLAIKYEREAYAAEHAYTVWSPPQSALSEAQPVSDSA